MKENRFPSLKDDFFDCGLKKSLKQEKHLRRQKVQNRIENLIETNQLNRKGPIKKAYDC